MFVAKQNSEVTVSKRLFNHDNNTCEVTGRGVAVYPDHVLIKTSTDISEWQSKFPALCTYTPIEKNQYTATKEHWGEKVIAQSQCFSWKMHSHYNDGSNLEEAIFKQNFSYKNCLFLFLPTHCPISLVFLVSLIFCSAVHVCQTWFLNFYWASHRQFQGSEASSS